MGEGEVSSPFDNFVGRERELAESRAALDEASSGRGRLLLLSGEPGIGKTRLAEQIAREASAHGMRAVWGRCWEGEGAPAYWPWVQVIRACFASSDSPESRSILESEQASSIVETVAQIVPELRAPASHPPKPSIARPNPEEARFQLFDSVAGLFKSLARLSPLAIILDDLHDADDASLMMLRFVARELKAASIVIVGTYREAEVRQSPELSKHIGELSRDARSLSLAGLSEAEVAKFVAASSGQMPEDELVSRLHAETAGNPLFVGGVVRMLITDRNSEAQFGSGDHFKIPHTLTEAIRRRLAVLSEETRSLLKMAAVIGNEFEAETCVQVGGIFGDELNLRFDEASDCGIVVPLGLGRYRFAHALIRRAAYDALDSNTRLRLHREIGEAIEHLHANDLRPHSAELAYHFREAGASEKAIKYFRRAAVGAYRVFSYEACAAHLHSLLALTRGQNDLRRADILFDLGNLNVSSLDGANGIAYLEQALSLYRELNNEEKVAITNVVLGRARRGFTMFAPERNIPRALKHFREAQAWQGEWTNPGSFAELHDNLGFVLFLMNRVDEAIESAKKARQTYEQLSNPSWLYAASSLAMFLVVKGRHREADAVLDEVAAASGVLHEEADPNLFRYFMWAAGWCRMSLRDPVEAKRLFAIGIQKKGTSPTQREGLFEFLASVELSAGNLSRARAIAAEHPVNPAARSGIAFMEGNWDAAIEINMSWLEWTTKTGVPWDRANALMTRFPMLRAAGDLERAREVRSQAINSYDPGDFLLEMKCRPEAALLAIEMGCPEEAVQHLELCRAILERGEDWHGMIASVERAEGMLAAVQGRDFGAHFERSIAVAKRYSLPWEAAGTLYHWGIALNRLLHYPQANEKFDAAVEIYRRHGAGQKWIDGVERARHAGADAIAATSTSTSPATFRKEGEFWTIAYQGATFRLKDIKGLAYLAFLIAHPGEQFHARDLAAVVDGSAVGKSLDASVGDTGLTVVGDLDGAAPGLDPRARADYRRRMNELKDELDEAERFNDIGRAARAREELDFLNAELASAAGIGGRARKSGSHAERARLMVGKNIRAAIEKVSRESPALGRFLSTAIRTGYHCSYQPDPDRPVSWQL